VFGVQIREALPVFLAKLVMDPPLLPPAGISEGQGSCQQQPREGQDGKDDFLQMGKHEMVSSVSW
jgi:hypothetical protein